MSIPPIPPSSDANDQDVGRTPGAEAIQNDLDQTRAQLGKTVDALVEKFDLKAQAEREIDSLKADARAMAKQLTAPSGALIGNPRTLLLVGAAAVLAAVVVTLTRRHH